MHNKLRKEAHRIFLQSVKFSVTHKNEAAELLEKEYHSFGRQTRIENHFNGLLIEQNVKDDVDIAAALAIVYKCVLKMSRQVPESHPGDSHKTEFLRKAVTGNAWVKVQISRIVTSALIFQQLYAELEISVQLKRETVTAAEEKTTNRTPTVDAVTNVKFTGQGRYGSGNKDFKSSFVGKKYSLF